MPDGEGRQPQRPAHRDEQCPQREQRPGHPFEQANVQQRDPYHRDHTGDRGIPLGRDHLVGIQHGRPGEPHGGLRIGLVDLPDVGLNPLDGRSESTDIRNRCLRPDEDEQQLVIIRPQEPVLRQGPGILRERLGPGRLVASRTLQPPIHLLQEREEQAEVGWLLLRRVRLQETREEMAEQ